jgi:hypothetical protein
MNNRYGLDAHYFKKKLEAIVRDIEHYTPTEMYRSLSILRDVAASQSHNESRDNQEGNSND